MRAVLGLDVGAGSTSGLLVETASGRVLARCAVAYPELSTGAPLRVQVVEQRADLWTDASVRALNELANTAQIKGIDIAAVGVSGMVAGLGAPVDGDFTVLRPVPLWQDRRGGEEARAAAGSLDAGMLREVTGNGEVSPYFGFVKLLWYMRSDPERFASTHAILSPAGLVVRMLTGEHVTDLCTLGAYGGILDVRRRCVSEEMLAELSRLGSELAGRHLDLTTGIFGRPVDPLETVGRVTLAGSGLTGVPEGVPVVSTGLDATSSMVAAGARVPGDNALVMGTSWVFGVLSERTSQATPAGMVHTPSPVHSDTLRFSMSMDPYTGGAAGFWMPELVTRASLTELEREAKMVPSGSSGVTFLPLLLGDRAPMGTTGPGGAFLGLRADHHRGHLFRAVLEGGAFLHEESLQAVRDAGMDVGPTRLVEGPYPCSLWRSIFADITGREVIYVPDFPGAAFGDAMLAALATGLVAEERMYFWLPAPQVLIPTRNQERILTYSRARDRFMRYRALLGGAEG